MPFSVASFVLPDVLELCAVLFDAALKGALLVILAGGLVVGMRRASAAARYHVWLLVVTGLMVIPVLSMLLPGWHVLPAWTELHFATAGPPGETRTPVGTPSSADSPATSLRDGISGMWVMAPLVWAAGSLVMMAPAALGLLSLRRLEAGTRVIRDGRWSSLLESLRGELGIRRRVLLLEGNEGCMPMTWGLFKTRILLPADAESWPVQRRRMVLLHELAHVRRGDFAADLMAKLARAMHWFNPLAWLAVRQLAVERERACDDLVLSSNSDAGEYAEHLLQVAAGLRSPRLAAALAIRMAGLRRWRDDCWPSSTGGEAGGA